MKPEELEVINAVIESATIDCGDRGFLQAWVNLDYGGASQGFGGFVLYVPKSFTHYKLKSVAGHFLFRVMEIAGVSEWSKLPGKTVRVRRCHSRVQAIGHIIKDDWFDPEADFKALDEEADAA